jgi:hypothetical protein
MSLWAFADICGYSIHTIRVLEVIVECNGAAHLLTTVCMRRLSRLFIFYCSKIRTHESQKMRENDQDSSPELDYVHIHLWRL